MALKKLKKSIALVLTAVMIGMPVINTAYAVEGDTTTPVVEETTTEEGTTTEEESTQVEEMLASEGFEEIDSSQIPEGVTPIVVNSEEELQAALESFETETSEMSAPVFYDLEQNNNTTSLSTKSLSTMSLLSAITYRNFHVAKMISLSTHNLFGTLKIDGSKIVSVHNLVQDWTGYQLGTQYQNHPAQRITYTITNYGQTAKIVAPYKVNYYIFHSGIGHLASQYGSTTFYVNK
jgi:hypothetical protein